MDAKTVIACAVGLLLLASGAQGQTDNFQRQISGADVQALQKARTLRAQKRSAEAVTLLQALVRRRPDYFNAQYELALALSDKPDGIAASLPVFETAAALKRSHPEVTDARVFNSMGWAYMYSGNTAKASAALAEAQANIQQLSPENQAKLYSNLGALHLTAGKRADAEKYLQIAAQKGSQPAQLRLETLEAVNKRQLALKRD
ncbi:MAG TPA: tetratricopeptide repeat protein [Burkholderiaceae bacterium]